MRETIFISGIDTDSGKTYATAWLASCIMAEGRSVITQKFIQTGNTDMSEDIVMHRSLTQMPMLVEDINRLTAPVIFSYPASAQLAARIDGRDIDLSVIDRATRVLQARYDTVLIEGAGGLMVPITDKYFTIDYISSRDLPVALVTNSRLGSINHTILSLEAIKSRGIRLHSVLYNTHFDKDKTIAEDTRAFIQRYVEREFPGTPILDVPTIDTSINALHIRRRI